MNIRFSGRIRQNLESTQIVSNCISNFKITDIYISKKFFPSKIKKISNSNPNYKSNIFLV